MRKFFSSKLFYLIFLIAVFSAIFFLDYKGLLDEPKNSTRNFFKPLVSFFSNNGNKATEKLSSLFSLRYFIEQNDFLLAQNLKLEASLSKMAELTRENSILKSQISLVDSGEIKFIFTNLFGRDPLNFSQAAMADAGQEDGVAEGAAAVGNGNILVGRIKEVFRSSSNILFITDKNSAVGAISQEKRISGILRGDGAGGLIFEIEASKESPREGEKIISAGGGNLFPKGLLIGEAKSDISSDAEAVKKIKIKPALEIGKIEDIFIVRQ